MLMQIIFPGILRLFHSLWSFATPYFLRFWPRVGRDCIPDLEQASSPAATAPKEPAQFRVPLKLNCEAIDNFIDSVKYTKVAALASRFNNGKKCKVFRHLHGSFNMCFMVEFLECKTRWAVRVPIEPALHDPWTKLQSEAATLKYVHANTNIPVPEVHALGSDAVLTNDGTKRQIFLITDLIDGIPATDDILKRLVKADEAVQERFFMQLISHLQDLRRLEFPRIGSLVSATDQEGKDEVVVGNILSFTADRHQITLPSCSTAQEYMSSQYDLLARHIAEPDPDL